MNKKAFLICFLALLLLVVIACREEVAPAPTSGFTVQSAFAEINEQFGPKLLGDPITGACLRDGGGMVQYFQNVRLEYDGQGRVQLTPLGQWALTGVRQQTPAPIPPNSRARFFPETGFAIQDQFLTFYEASDGELLLGPPISPQLDEGELRVQYFRNGRLEWRPDAPPAQRVRLSRLGQAHFVQGGAVNLGCDIRARFAEDAGPGPASLDVSVRAPILYTGDEQIVYVKVLSPQRGPVEGVQVFANVRSQRQNFEVELGTTGGDGLVSGSLGETSFVPGQTVLLNVRAVTVDGTFLGQTTFSFETWW